ncbi:MAG: Gfo/Idh/MocA family oxidoreductase [candidate division WS1 bacterium]|nr:Gfo/Idh/MocA family oxidoreductase [candidate division WS1 bacterium]
MTKPRVGVVGLGGNGRAFVRGYAESDLCELAAVCDLNPDRTSAAVAEIDAAPIEFQDLDTMLSSADLDLLSVHTPDHLHAEPFIAGLQAGCHVLVEKPMGNTLEDLERMIAAARASDRKTLVGHILRFNPVYEQVHRLCAEGRLGQVFYLEADYFHGLKRQAAPERINPHIGGINWWLEHEKVIVGGGAHQFDLLRWYADSHAVEVTGYGNSIVFPEMKHPDCMCAIFKLASGAVAKVGAAYGVVGPRPEWLNLEVYGTEGTIRGGQFISGDHDNPTVQDLRVTYEGHPFAPEIEHFLRCIIEDTEPLVDAFEGANSAAATIVAAESVEAGGVPMEVPHFQR